MSTFFVFWRMEIELIDIHIEQKAKKMRAIAW